MEAARRPAHLSCAAIRGRRRLPERANGRLAELRELGIVELGDDGYAMTEAGHELGDVLMTLNGWADAHL